MYLENLKVSGVIINNERTMRAMVSGMFKSETLNRNTERKIIIPVFMA